MQKLIEELCEGLWGSQASKLAYKRTSQEVSREEISRTPVQRARVHVVTPQVELGYNEHQTLLKKTERYTLQALRSNPRLATQYREEKR